jgi:dienelactone hydrolase
MPITNLYAQWQYPDVGTDFPICVLMHGFGGSANDFDAATMKQIAQYGLFALTVGMRGRNGASGSQDASGLEIYDIYDALVYVRANFASKVSSSHAGIVGYSGGGGNALAAACKFPDTWTMVVSHFGMSDYGRANPDGW